MNRGATGRLGLAVGLICFGLAGCVGNENPLGPSVNRAPEIRSIAVTPAVVLVGGSAAVKVDAIDPDGDQLFYRYTAQSGSIVPDNANPAQATYVHGGAPDRISDLITVTVTDTRNATASASRAVALLGNRPPEVRVTGGGSCHPDCQVHFSAEASDPDGDPLSYLWSGCARGSGRSASCTVSSLGTVTASVVVSDGRGGVASDSGIAEGVNQAPVVTGGQDMYADRARFLVNYRDPDGDDMTCGWWGDCECTGSYQSYNLICSLPDGVASCFERFSCTDPFGASGETTFHLIR